MAADDTSAHPAPRPDERLGSWKAIAAYMKRDVTTVQRWERREGMPVHRHRHDRRGSVYAYRGELDAWLAQRTVPPGADDGPDAPGARGVAAARAELLPRPTKRVAIAVVAGVLAALGVVLLSGRGAPRQATRAPLAATTARPVPLADARFTLLTDFAGVERAAAISRDGRHVAFLSARGGTLDVWVTRVGSGEFRNLTNGRVPELLNPEVRSVDFTPDGAHVLFWTRTGAGSAVATWAVPFAGGEIRPYRDRVVELDFTRDAKRAVYHTADPGDPTFVVDAGGAPRRIDVGAPGVHNHFQVWGPDERTIWFVRGTPPDAMDLWRIRDDGTGLERMTFHESRVLYPTFLDARTLLYLATTPDGAGPWLYAFDLERRASQRISFGVEQYGSLAASADRRRLVATVGRAKSSLWRAPIGAAPVGEASASRLDVPTVGGSAPRLGPGYLLYVARKNDGHALQKLVGTSATELWSAPRTRIAGGPAIAPDGRTIAFTAEGPRGTRLYLADAGRTGARVLDDALEVRGAPAWSPDGLSVAVAALRDGVPRLVRVPLDGGGARPLVDAYSTNPAWSPDGTFLVYAGADAGPDFTLHAVNADGTPRPLPEIRLPRGARRVAFTPDGRSLLVLSGPMRAPDFHLVDIASGRGRRLTEFAQESTVRDFDLSADGREIVFDRQEDDADVVLIEKDPSR